MNYENEAHAMKAEANANARLYATQTDIGPGSGPSLLQEVGARLDALRNLLLSCSELSGATRRRILGSWPTAQQAGKSASLNQPIEQSQANAIRAQLDDLFHIAGEISENVAAVERGV